MGAASTRFGWSLAVVQLFFTLAWTTYAIYLPKLAASAGIAAGAVIVILMLDQAVFTVCDFATGIAADRLTRTLGRLGVYVTAATALSCLAFLALPFLAPAGAAVFLALTLVWTATSSALRAPPLMLLGKYTAKPQQPFLAGLALLGSGVAGALAPYLAVALRERDPRWPFALASLAVILTTLGMVAAERRLKPDAPKPQGPAFGRLDGRAALFAIALIVLALGYQVHFALESAPMYLRFAGQADLAWLMPVFWVGFNITMFPAGWLTRRIGGYAVMGAGGLIGALAIVAAHFANGLGFLIAAQAFAGGAWGAILMSAYIVAFSLGENGGEGRLTGILFSALAIATFARMSAVAAGYASDPALKAALAWVPTVCWAAAGAALLALGWRLLRRT